MTGPKPTAAARATRHGPSARLVAVAVLPLTVTSGCGSPQQGSAEAVARDFIAAVREGDVTRACRLLAPRTKSELEQSTGRPCAEALLREDLSQAGVASIAETEVYGLAGIVRLRDDTVFVARFRGGWRSAQPVACLPPDAASTVR